MDGTLARLSTYVSNGYENPLKKTTVTMYVNPARRDDMATTRRSDGFDPRLQDGRAFSLGPGPKVIGGQLMSAYDDRPASGPRMGATKDFADILRDFKSQRTPSDGADATSATGGAPADGAATAQRGRRAGGPMAQRKGHVGQQTAEQAQHAQAAAQAAATRPGGTQTWQSRRLLNSLDLPQGPTLGARETMGAPNMHIIASKHVFIPPQVQLSGDASGSSAGMPTSQGVGPWGRHTLGTLNEYAANKGLGHAEYERACKGLDGAGSWQRTLQDLHASMHVARPSRLQSPTEHMAGTLHTLNTLRSEGLVR